MLSYSQYRVRSSPSGLGHHSDFLQREADLFDLSFVAWQGGSERDYEALLPYCHAALMPGRSGLGPISLNNTYRRILFGITPNKPLALRPRDQKYIAKCLPIESVRQTGIIRRGRKKSKKDIHLGEKRATEVPADLKRKIDRWSRA